MSARAEAGAVGRAPAPAVLPGLLLAAGLAALALLLAELPWIKNTLHLSALLIVIVLGMVWRTLRPVPATTLPGVRLAQRTVLRWAVAGLGFRLSLGELWRIGLPSLVVVTVSTFAALLFGFWIARRLGLNDKLGQLLSVGGAVCGASAVVAADSVIQGDKRDAPVALGTITLLGTLGIVLYPVIARLAGLGDFIYGVWDGASLHEMAQVVAAGFGVSDEAARVATVVKLARIALLAPIVLGLAWSRRRHHLASGQPQVAPLPWFLVLFVIFAAINSTGLVPAAWIDVIRRVDLWMLCVGMAGVGLQTGFGDLREAGLRPIAAGALQWLFLATLAYLLARWLVG